MQQRMNQEEIRVQQKSEAEKKKIQRQEERAEKAAVESQRRATRQTDATAGGVAGPRGDPKPKKATTGSRPKKQNGTITDWLKKADVESKAGGMTVAEAVAEAAEEEEVKQSGFGAEGLRPANQPAAVTGGIMRNYQLEGLAWLRSLYENGLNGILADEMGLGKTIQTISFLAFLREMESYGPFLIVAPLSTLSNWIDEFAKWTPGINTVLYHGSPAERAELRAAELKQPGSPRFPVVCTSYEICMNDRKFLSDYGWKFIIIVCWRHDSICVFRC
jgi:ATP-dependent DNA helicase